VTRRKAIPPPPSLTPPEFPVTLASMSAVPDTEPHQPAWLDALPDMASNLPPTTPAPVSDAWEARVAFRRAAAISRSLTHESGRYAVTDARVTSDGLDVTKRGKR
jgi:hypothetical protein